MVKDGESQIGYDCCKMLDFEQDIFLLLQRFDKENWHWYMDVFKVSKIWTLYFIT